MRYLGNKTNLLGFIDFVINKYQIEGKTFLDLFAGTGAVSDFFKDRFNIISNDYMYFSKVISHAKINNSEIPQFTEFHRNFKCSPFMYFNKKVYEPTENYFIYQNYTPIGNRMYLNENNGIRIDGIRQDIEEYYKLNIISENEYYFLLASLIESVPSVSNTSGTYQAFFKFWESRATKDYEIKPLKVLSKNIISKKNKAYCVSSNTLIRELSGDIVYIDPPYTVNQYTNSYHLLETIARYDFPDIFGKTGRRKNRELSTYSNKTNVYYEFEDLFRQIQYKHIILSYSNQGLMPLDDLIALAKIFAKNGKVFVESYEYRKYATNNLSHKGNKLKEIIIYFEKDLTINKSPLNFSGSKDELLPIIFKHLPKHISNFVDAMGGAFNVGANVFACEKVFYNEYNPHVYGLIKMLIENSPEVTIKKCKYIIEEFHLKKKAKEEYLNLRKYFNSKQGNLPIYLFVLQIFAFQNIIRFNSSMKMNTPVGNNEFSDGIKSRIMNFRIKSPSLMLINDRFENLNIEMFDKGTLFYFDPPYYVTNAEYNDGKRGFDGWDSKSESTLLNFLLKLHRNGFKFILSNVLTHKGRENHLLIEWIQTHSFNVISVGETGIKFPRYEVIVTNYSKLD